MPSDGGIASTRCGKRSPPLASSAAVVLSSRVPIGRSWNSDRGPSRRLTEVPKMTDRRGMRATCFCD
jgi:hypothetical protein